MPKFKFRNVLILSKLNDAYGDGSGDEVTQVKQLILALSSDAAAGGQPQPTDWLEIFTVPSPWPENGIFLWPKVTSDDQLTFSDAVPEGEGEKLGAFLGWADDQSTSQPWNTKLKECQVNGTERPKRADRECKKLVVERKTEVLGLIAAALIGKGKTKQILLNKGFNNDEITYGLAQFIEGQPLGADFDRSKLTALGFTDEDVAAALKKIYTAAADATAKQAKVNKLLAHGFTVANLQEAGFLGDEIKEAFADLVGDDGKKAANIARLIKSGESYANLSSFLPLPQQPAAAASASTQASTSASAAAAPASPQPQSMPPGAIVAAVKSLRGDSVDNPQFTLVQNIKLLHDKFIAGPGVDADATEEQKTQAIQALILGGYTIHELTQDGTGFTAKDVQDAMDACVQGLPYGSLESGDSFNLLVAAGVSKDKFKGKMQGAAGGVAASPTTDQYLTALKAARDAIMTAPVAGTAIEPQAKHRRLLAQTTVFARAGYEPADYFPPAADVATAAAAAPAAAVATAAAAVDGNTIPPAGADFTMIEIAAGLIECHREEKKWTYPGETGGSEATKAAYNATNVRVNALGYAFAYGKVTRAQAKRMGFTGEEIKKALQYAQKELHYTLPENVAELIRKGHNSEDLASAGYKSGQGRSQLLEGLACYCIEIKRSEVGKVYDGLCRQKFTLADLVEAGFPVGLVAGDRKDHSLMSRVQRELEKLHGEFVNTETTKARKKQILQTVVNVCPIKYLIESTFTSEELTSGVEDIFTPAAKRGLLNRFGYLTYFLEKGELTVKLLGNAKITAADIIASFDEVSGRDAAVSFLRQLLASTEFNAANGFEYLYSEGKGFKLKELLAAGLGLKAIKDYYHRNGKGGAEGFFATLCAEFGDGSENAKRRLEALQALKDSGVFSNDDGEGIKYLIEAGVSYEELLQAGFPRELLLKVAKSPERLAELNTATRKVALSSPGFVSFVDALVTADTTPASPEEADRFLRSVYGDEFTKWLTASKTLLVNDLEQATLRATRLKLLFGAIGKPEFGDWKAAASTPTAATTPPPLDLQPTDSVFKTLFENGKLKTDRQIPEGWQEFLQTLLGSSDGETVSPEKKRLRETLTFAQLLSLWQNHETSLDTAESQAAKALAEKVGRVTPENLSEKVGYLKAQVRLGEVSLARRALRWDEAVRSSIASSATKKGEKKALQALNTAVNEAIRKFTNAAYSASSIEDIEKAKNKHLNFHTIWESLSEGQRSALNQRQDELEKLKKHFEAIADAQADLHCVLFTQGLSGLAEVDLAEGEAASGADTSKNSSDGGVTVELLKRQDKILEKRQGIITTGQAEVTGDISKWFNLIPVIGTILYFRYNRSYHATFNAERNTFTVPRNIDRKGVGQFIKHLRTMGWDRGNGIHVTIHNVSEWRSAQRIIKDALDQGIYVKISCDDMTEQGRKVRTKYKDEIAKFEVRANEVKQRRVKEVETGEQVNNEGFIQEINEKMTMINKAQSPVALQDSFNDWWDKKVDRKAQEEFIRYLDERIKSNPNDEQLKLIRLMTIIARLRDDGGVSYASDSDREAVENYTREHLPSLQAHVQELVESGKGKNAYKVKKKWRVLFPSERAFSAVVKDGDKLRSVGADAASEKEHKKETVVEGVVRATVGPTSRQP